MKKYRHQWEVSTELTIEHDKLFEEIKENLSDWEAKLIWCLRNLPKGTTATFYFTAKKLYDAEQAKNNLINILDKLQ